MPRLHALLPPRGAPFRLPAAVDLDAEDRDAPGLDRGRQEVAPGAGRRLDHDVGDPGGAGQVIERGTVERPSGVQARHLAQPPAPLEHLAVLVRMGLVVDVHRYAGVEAELIQPGRNEVQVAGRALAGHETAELVLARVGLEAGERLDPGYE